MNVHRPRIEDNEWLIDMHTHLGFVSNPDELAKDYNMHHIAGLCATVTPQEYRGLIPKLAGHTNICLGLGAHPWWIHDDRISDDDLKYMLDDIENVQYIAEIGLDFSNKFSDIKGRDRQIYWFKKICQTISQCIANTHTPYILSIHSVKATDEVLSILEEYDLPSRAICIFHWFSGTHDELMRATAFGCYFSINNKMLQSKRAKSYLRTIPSDRIFLETDMPEENQYWNGALERERLVETCNMLYDLTDEHLPSITARKHAELLDLEISL